METLFIADDEQSIREGLKYILDWEALGFTLCGEAGNGEEALNKLQQLRPSLALLDVRMPKMMGTEVIKRAREAGYQGKCIILSGFSDFTYAQGAIESGVSFYLTKPLDEDELYKSVCKIRDELALQKQTSSNLTQLRSRAREVVLRDLVQGSCSFISREDRELFHLDADCYQIALCQSFRRNQPLPYTVAELLRTTNQGNYTFDQFMEEDREVILLKGKYGLRRLAEIVEHFDESPQEGSALNSIFLTYGPPVSRPEDIHISYQQATLLLQQRFYCPMDQHYMGYEDFPELITNQNHPLDSKLLASFSDKIKNFILSYNHQLLADTFQDILHYISGTSSNVSDIKLYLIDLYFQVKEQVIRAFPKECLPFPSSSEVISFVQESNYLSEIICFISEQCTRIMDATGSPSRDTILDDIIYYIDHNYSDNIKLESIAPLFGYNSAYLGKIFTKAVGESFNSYVDHKRIEASCKLLESDNQKVYEIAEKVGYKNVDYFHKKFRKYTGESPAEYRKKRGSTKNP